MADRFNVRVYGIWLHNGHLLVTDEIIKGEHVIKFPGGGLELGEGTIDGLKREWKEELDIEIEILDHFYTTDYFQPSAYDNSQVISIYYLVTANTIPGNFTTQNPTDQVQWLDITTVAADTFTLPIDKRVGNMLHILYS